MKQYCLSTTLASRGVSVSNHVGGTIQNSVMNLQISWKMEIAPALILPRSVRGDPMAPESAHQAACVRMKLPLSSQFSTYRKQRKTRTFICMNSQASIYQPCHSLLLCCSPFGFRHVSYHHADSAPRGLQSFLHHVSGAIQLGEVQSHRFLVLFLLGVPFINWNDSFFQSCRTD
jgi:hypothetical protein